MASFSKGTSFTDGVTGDVTAAKLHALVDAATPVPGFITDRTAETSIATDDLVLISDTSDSGALNKMTVANFTNIVSTGTGTASDPAIRPTGDTNTGIFFPAADTAAISTAGSERVRVDSSGNVGIGTTSPAYNLDVRGSNNVYLAARATGSANNTTAFIRADTDGVVFGQTGTSATPIIFDQAGTERLRIDSNGNVGIGTNSPSYKVDVVGSPNNEVSIRAYNSTAGSLATARVYAQSDTASIQMASYSSTFGFDLFGTNAANYSGLITSGDSSAGLMLGTLTSDPIIIGTDGTQRMRITSGGEVYIAGTTDQGAYNLQVNGTGVWGAGAYVNGSDERLKENIQDITSGLDVVEKLRPVSFQYKEEYTADRSVQSGFIAQDLLVALEGKNYLEGVVSQGPTYYNVAYQNLIPILAKAIQELKAENDSLKTRIAALEAA